MNLQELANALEPGKPATVYAAMVVEMSATLVVCVAAVSESRKTVRFSSAKPVVGMHRLPAGPQRVQSWSPWAFFVDRPGVVGYALKELSGNIARWKASVSRGEQTEALLTRILRDGDVAFEAEAAARRDEMISELTMPHKETTNA